MNVRIVNCSIETAPCSPGRRSSCSNLSEDFYFSEPTSPTHFLTYLLQTSVSDSKEYGNESHGIKPSNVSSFEFEFSSCYSQMAGHDQPFAEELFLNGQIRPLNQQTKSEYNIFSPRPPLCSGSNMRPDEDAFQSNNHKEFSKGRSTSLRNFLWDKSAVNEDRILQGGSKRWRLKDFLDRGSRKDRPSFNNPAAKQAQKHSMKQSNNSALKPIACARYDDTKIILESGTGGGGNKYSKKKKKADESRRKSFLPYTRALLGCFINGFLHPFSPQYQGSISKLKAGGHRK